MYAQTYLGATTAAVTANSGSESGGRTQQINSPRTGAAAAPMSERSIRDILPGLFQLPWYCSELSGTSESLRRTGSASTAPGDDGDNHRRPKSSTRSSSVRTIGTAEALARENCELSLRFCRYSTPSVIFTPAVRAEAVAEGTCVALCRVLVRKVKTFQSSEDLSPDDMAAAVAASYDAVHFTST